MLFSSILTFFVLPVLTADCLVMAEPGVVPLLFPALVVIHSKLNSIRELLALWWAHKWCIDFILENSESVEMVFCVLTQICNGVV